MLSTEVNFAIKNQHHIPAVGLEMRGESWRGGQEEAEMWRHLSAAPSGRACGVEGRLTHTLPIPSRSWGK